MVQAYLMNIPDESVTLGAFSLYEPVGGIICANLPIIYPMIAEKIRRSPRTSAAASKEYRSEDRNRISSPRPSARPDTFDTWRHLNEVESTVESGGHDWPYKKPDSPHQVQASEVEESVVNEEVEVREIPEHRIAVRQTVRSQVQPKRI
jgi:hypothetical protein